MTTAHSIDGPSYGGTDPAPDLFARVVATGSKHERPVLVGTVIMALLLHGAFGGVAALRSLEIGNFAALVRAAAAQRVQPVIDIEAPEEIAEPEPPPPEPEPLPPEPEEPPPLEVPREATLPAAAPAAAEAAAVLTAPAEPDAPLDLTDQGFISGSGTRFAGGVTAANGTSSNAVRNPGAVANGVPQAVGTAPTGPAVASRARGAGLLKGSAAWNTDFPAEADAEQINQAVVRLVVVVGKDGRPKSVTVVDDPGFGFGRQAKRYAMTQMFEPALDASGNPIEATTPPFKVRFQR